MAEVGGLSISIRATAIPGDAASETHSDPSPNVINGGLAKGLTFCFFRIF